ncbi:MAG: alpha-glucan family phosphorylase [Elusimicrobia bacterium]|nr:alpha-glucan family phosphorylase [Elusimicrobiota bacterium]
MEKDLFNLQSEKFLLKNFRRYISIPHLPENLKPLLDIAYNLWWSWNSDAIELFRRMDRDEWELAYHNPIKLLAHIGQDKLKKLSEDDSFLTHLERIQEDLKHYLEMTTWHGQEFPEHKAVIAYFSTEFGLYESLPIYSGGLGVLSGDHIKSASDMGLPMVAVGLLYRYGYFKQYLNFDGWQQEEYTENHFFRMPLQIAKNSNGDDIKISVEHPKGRVYARIWKVQVGRVPLFLLDTDIDENSPEDRDITGYLYGGDREMRIRQETVLGIGGIRALKALNIVPDVVHLNEGHSAFLILERIRMLMEQNNLGYEEAKEIVKASSVFTTHTPVPAGNEVFAPELVSKYMEPIIKKLGITAEELVKLGKVNPEDVKEGFGMTVLALKMTGYANGVSKLHGTISRNMWKPLWPDMPKNEIPITSITNGIHTNTWISYEMAGLFDRYMGNAWKDEPANQSIWQRVEQIPDAELWRSHERRRERLVSFARTKLKAQLIRRGASRNEIDYADQVLDPEALTIGFGRRFASYKRGDLLFRDLARIKNILVQKEKPVQLIIAGKAHPQDNFGKELIKSIIHISRDPDLRSKIVFIEDYDMNVAHYMVQGADVWLNNPRRPSEASGTSGMKVAVNGVLNLSVLDGWWCEGYNGENGWSIGAGEEYSDPVYQDEVESKAIYDLLEKEIIPLFYDRTRDGLPRGWIKKMKTSMQTIGPAFNTNRMIEDYTRKFYIPAHVDYFKMVKDNFAGSKNFVQWQKFICKKWSGIKVLSVDDNLKTDVELGNSFKVTAKIKIGEIRPEDLSVEIYWGYLDSKHNINGPASGKMKLAGSSDGTCTFEGTIKADRVGHCGYAIRVLPQFEGKVLFIPGLITWQ